MIALEDLLPRGRGGRKCSLKKRGNTELNFFMHSDCEGLKPCMCDGVNHYKFKHEWWGTRLKLQLIGECDNSCESPWAEDGAISESDRRKAKRLYYKQIKG